MHGHQRTKAGKYTLGFWEKEEDDLVGPELLAKVKSLKKAIKVEDLIKKMDDQHAELLRFAEYNADAFSEIQLIYRVELAAANRAKVDSLKREGEKDAMIRHLRQCQRSMADQLPPQKRPYRP